MKLVIGGAFQGKRSCATERYGIGEGWIDGADCGFEELAHCAGIFHFHEYVRRALAEDDPELRKESGDPDFVDVLSGRRPGGVQDCASRQGGDGKAPWQLDLDRRAGEFAGLLQKTNREIVIVTNELGCGVVPVDRFDREYRETVGRVCTALAARADEVIRVVCGIPVVLKGQR